MLGDLLGDVPLLVDNDANLAAIAERWHGAAHEVSSFAYVYLGAGMGLGLVIDDKLIRAVCAVVDPELVILGSPIGAHPALLEPVLATVAELAPLPPPVSTGAPGDGASMQGALVLAPQRGSASLNE